jgi:putative nucleotidyltransferase with HDIG domain
LPAAVRERLVERVQASKLELPLLPRVATEVMRACADDTSDARTLAEMVRSDQAMAGHVLRIANTPAYMPAVRIVSLQQAVSRLGMKTIRDIALLVACQSRVFNVAGFAALMQAWFRHALGTALFAQEVARRRRWNVEEAFLAGLLHDVGRPVLLQALMDLHRDAGLTADRDAVVEATGELHERVGAALISSWGLPDRVAEATGHHHAPPREGAMAQLTMVIGLADDLAHVALGPRTVTEDEVRHHALLPALNLYPDDVEALLAHRARVVESVAAIA